MDITFRALSNSSTLKWCFWNHSPVSCNCYMLQLSLHRLLILFLQISQSLIPATLLSPTSLFSPPAKKTPKKQTNLLANSCLCLITSIHYYESAHQHRALQCLNIPLYEYSLYRGKCLCKAATCDPKNAIFSRRYHSKQTHVCLRKLSQQSTSNTDASANDPKAVNVVSPVKLIHEFWREHYLMNFLWIESN